MKRLIKCLWQDEHGVILSTEIVIVGSVLVVGLITGMATLQEAVNGELNDLAGAIGSLDQSYSFSGQETDCRNCYGCTAGSSYRDIQERCDEEPCDIAADAGQIKAMPYVKTACVTQSCEGSGCNSCTSCGQRSCGGGCGSQVLNCEPGPHCVRNGVPHMKSTVWPLEHSAIAATPAVISTDATSCVPACSTKKPYLNIPESVW
jgi:Flp pilus assembly pilin Flp